jgi:UDP-N-acetylglucosamine 2-epimerase (non-hydrolysing)
MIKVLSIIGTRPEAIKMIPVVQELAKHPYTFSSKVCVTGQHRQMLDSVLQLFDIVPDYDLNVMRSGQSLTNITTAILGGLESILQAEQPDWVVVQGDTTTTMAASLAAFYQRIKVAHLEAGLRTHDKYQPYPEEINRRMVSVIGDLHLAPTEWAADNLRREGVPENTISVTGNTVIDALKQVARLPFNPVNTVLEKLPIGRKRIILVTAHRRENFGQGMEEICLALKTIAKTHEDVHLVYPVHLNPNVQEPVYRHLGHLPNISLLPPLDYQPLVWLMKHSYMVLTDSGGLQEEAPALGKPVLVLRDTTERPEGIKAGTVRLVGADAEQIIHSVGHLLKDAVLYESMAQAVNPYGNGQAANKTVKAIYLNSAPETRSIQLLPDFKVISDQVVAVA